MCLLSFGPSCMHCHSEEQRLANELDYLVLDRREFSYPKRFRIPISNSSSASCCSEEQRLASELDYLVFRRILTPVQVW